MKKFICVVCCLALCLGVLGGCGGKKRYAAPIIADGSILEFTIYAFDSKSESKFALMNLGHGFVSVKNVTKSPITVGGFVLGQDKEVSIGTWGQNAHWGIWYNLESTYLTLGRYKGITSLTQGVSTLGLDNLNAYLLANDTWTPLRNCSYFALDMWNTLAAADDVMDLGWLVTPAEVSDRIRQTDGYKTDRPIINFDKVGYAKNSDATAFSAFTIKELEENAK